MILFSIVKRQRIHNDYYWAFAFFNILTKTDDEVEFLFSLFLNFIHFSMILVLRKNLLGFIRNLGFFYRSESQVRFPFEYKNWIESIFISFLNPKSFEFCIG